MSALLKASDRVYLINTQKPSNLNLLNLPKINNSNFSFFTQLLLSLVNTDTVNVLGPWSKITHPIPIGTNHNLSPAL